MGLVKFNAHSRGRWEDVKKNYTNHQGLWEEGNELFLIGDQLKYEWEQDFITMKWALKRISEFLKVANEKGIYTGTLNIARNELMNRISKHSCPSNLKQEYKTKDNCPLGASCQCNI